MVGLSDIPCVGKVVDRISDATVDALFRGLKYMFCYKALVKELNSEMKNLNSKKDKMSRKAEEERNNGKMINDDVLTWQKEVEGIQKSAQKISPSWRCIQCLPIPNPVSRFRLGREAVQKTKMVIELNGSGTNLLDKEISYLPPVRNLPNTSTTFQDFQSRKDAYEKIWKDLAADESPLILGIYGMPGVGKTRMMEQIWKETKEKRIFNKVARADVGNEQLDVMKLQSQIAGHLNCHFDSQDNEERRASQLKNSLMNGGKILIIFDDVWREIPIDRVIGTSFGDGSKSKGSKILLTSRKEDVCLRNKCKHPVKITTLTDQESWDLFKNIVGICQIDTLQDKSLAERVCNKCAGLPLLIHAVGKALQFATHHLWNDALLKLEKGKFENIAGIDPQAYACVAWSIDRLPSDAKSCILLCSLFPEDADIHIKKLVQLATGLQLIPDGESTVRAMVDILRIHSLLLEGKRHCVKLHDVIRDVARSIAAKDYAFLFARCGSRLPYNADYVTRKLLHLDLESADAYFPDDLVCPDLHNLWLRYTRNAYLQPFSGGFYSMFVNLRVLVLQDAFFRSKAQFSLHPLINLKGLFLYGCVVERTEGFFPESLETLCIFGGHISKAMHLQNLKSLRKLEVSIKRGLAMLPNAISSLSSLKELHIMGGFEIRGHPLYMDPCFEHRSYLDEFSDAFISWVPILDEISELTHLTSLEIFIENSEPFHMPSTFNNLSKYHICVGPLINSGPEPLIKHISTTRSLDLSGHHVEGFESLMERSEELLLRKTDVKLSSMINSNCKAFSDLTSLFIEYCDTMEFLATISRDEIQHDRVLRTSFSNLISLEIFDCSAVKYLFCNSVAKLLGQLQVLSIHDCPAMEGIIMTEGTSNSIIIFSQLKSLHLMGLPRLKSFCMEKKDMHSGSTLDNFGIPSVQSHPLFDGMVAFPSLENLFIRHLDDIGDIWGKFYNSNDNECSSFCKLKTLPVEASDKPENMIPLGMLHMVRNLESISIDGCNSLRNVFLHSSIARNLIHLKKLFVSKCEMMREIIGGAGEQQISGDIVLPELTDLNLWYLPNLSEFWCYHSGEANIYKVDFPKLVDFEMNCMINLDAIELGRDDSPGLLTILKISCDKDMRLPYKWQLQFDNLKRLSMKGYSWWHELKFSCFQKLEVLEVVDSQCSTLFSISAFGSLQQLQKLEISNCPLLENIVEDAKGDEGSSGMDKHNMLLFNLSSLESVILKDLPNLKSLFDGVNYKCNVPALVEVKVNNCGLSTLFTCSVFGDLQKLQYIEVLNCRLLEGIVENVRGDETSDMNDVIIIYSQLRRIFLRNLPKLRSFSCTRRYAFSMPELESITLYECPSLENATFLKLNPGVMHIYDDKGREKGVPDVNPFNGIDLSDSDGEHETEFESVEEDQPQSDEEQPQSVEDDQPRSEEKVEQKQPLQATLFSLPWSCPWAF